jgi:PAS domain-containing protein
MHKHAAGKLIPGGLSTDDRAVVIINAQSVIQITNDIVTSMLGFPKSELKGRNLRVMLPPSVADVHQSFVRNHVLTGKPHWMPSGSVFVA